MNPMQMFQNPQQFIQKMMGNSQIMQNPIMKNALKMAKSGDVKGVEVEDFVAQIKQNIGI